MADFFRSRSGAAGSRGSSGAERRLCTLALWALGACHLFACTEEVRLGRVLGDADAASAAAAGGGPAGGGAGGLELPQGGAPPDAAGGTPAAGECVRAACGEVVFACGNCEDDDADGRLDAADPECLGPCDDSESELFSGTVARVTGSCRVDCYFDRNLGAGDDGCGWSYRCDPLSVAPDYPPTGSAMCEHDPAEPSCGGEATLAACAASCLPLTPNGCDCFGCCELPASSGQYRWLGSEGPGQAHCELSSSGDPESCRPCTPAPSCLNPCEECELCVGKAQLPGACAGAAPACAPGVRSCDPGATGGCGALEYCITGCCITLPR